MEKTRSKNQIKNNVENFGLNREMDLINNGSGYTQILSDRDLFFKFSNENVELDMSKPNHEDAFGMPIFNGQILNNKKSLITSPYIVENNNKNNFVSNFSSIDSNDMYAELDPGTEQKFDNDIFKYMAYNNKDNFKDKETEVNNSVCKIEKEILEFEFELNKNKKKEFLVDTNSPFALGYIWKSLLLLTKNPSTDKLLKLLGVKNRDSMIQDMKYNSDVFSDGGSIVFNIPVGNQVTNSNFITKIESIYKIKINPIDESYESRALVELNYLFNLEIPFYYQPKITIDYMLGYKKNKIKYIEMTNVPVNLTILRDENVVTLEIPCGSNMTLGFIYDLNRSHVNKLPLKLMLQEKKPEILVKKLVIPKINRNKKSEYGKKFQEELSGIHLGEIVYGYMYDIDINVNMGLNINITQDVSKNKYEIVRNIDLIEINHKCFYYIKNSNIENKILVSGMINYQSV